MSVSMSLAMLTDTMAYGSFACKETASKQDKAKSSYLIADELYAKKSGLLKFLRETWVIGACKQSIYRRE